MVTNMPSNTALARLPTGTTLGVALVRNPQRVPLIEAEWELRRAQAAQGDALRSMMAGYARLGDRIEDLCARLDHHAPPPPSAAEPLPTAEEETADAAAAAGTAGAATAAASDDDASLLPRSELDSSGLVRANSRQGSSK